jgi:hypothetical protein
VEYWLHERNTVQGSISSVLLFFLILPIEIKKETFLTCIYFFFSDAKCNSDGERERERSSCWHSVSIFIDMYIYVCVLALGLPAQQAQK